MRSIIHRIAAVIFIAVSVTHLVSLIVSRKLRAHWMEMLPNRRDPREAASGFAYNLGLGSEPPQRSAHSYVEGRILGRGLGSRGHGVHRPATLGQ
jgi:hypothetical protein